MWFVEFYLSELSAEVVVMGYRSHDAPTPLLIGYDPCVELPSDHLARLVESVVEEAIPDVCGPVGPGQPAYDPRLCVKVLVYGYATGVRSSRQLEKHCRESLPYLYLTRGDTPSYRTLCSARLDYADLLEQAWTSLFVVAGRYGMNRLGRIAVDSSKFAANASAEMTLDRNEYGAVRAALKEILAEAQAVDSGEDADGYAGETRTGKSVDRCQMREIVRKVRNELAKGSGEPCGGGSDGDAPDAKKPRRALSERMVARVHEALSAIDEAESEGRKHLCLTDPDAGMMHGGREKVIRQCHSLEVAVDRDCGLLVAENVTQAGNDNERLEYLVESAACNTAEGVSAVDGDSGYFKIESVIRLMQRGIDVCVPDSTTACELHRGLPVGSLRRHGTVCLEYDSGLDEYRCPQGNVLTLRSTRGNAGETVKRYQARRSCRGCLLYSECLVRMDGKPARSEQEVHQDKGARQ